MTLNENETVAVHKKTPQAFVVNKCNSESRRECDVFEVRSKPRQTFGGLMLFVKFVCLFGDFPYLLWEPAQGWKMLLMRASSVSNLD